MSKNVRRVVAIGLVVLLVSAGMVFAAGSSEKGKTYTIKVGDNWGATHPMGRAINEVFKTQVEKATNGAVKVDVYSDGTLGSEGDLWNGVRNGTIEMAIIGTPFNQEWSKSLISDWPFLYRDLEHAKKVWTGEIADQMNAEFHEKFPSAYMLAWGPNSARTFSSNKKLTSVADFVGQKFRMPSNPIHIGIAQNLGASAQVIPLNELFSALETGVVDGQDNGMVTILSQSFDQVQKYVYETNHIIATLEIVISAPFFDSLPAEYQQAITAAAKATTEKAWNDYIASVDVDRQTLRDRGVVVTACTKEDQALIIQKIQPLLDTLYAQNDWAKDLTTKIKNY
ncbi:MAG: TRAP transporter substrate-binding protein [Sphaerochaeta sp.]|jgi:tripartite ATP-independent transporter DctP family solute receptor|uniref:TRAP transporter substrate-binding protein n=1 Tax=Sphaerochaeta sp. TaxID=1972642 RepID=UPI002FC616BF